MLSEGQRTAKLVQCLSDNGCRRISVDIPGFEYNAKIETGIALTRYVGEDEKVIIESEYGGQPVTGIGHSLFAGCKTLTGKNPPHASLCRFFCFSPLQALQQEYSFRDSSIS